MHTAPPPDDVTRLMRAHGVVPVAPVGSDGSWWVARPAPDADPDAPWLEVLVADVPVDAALAARAGALTGVRHAHLAAVLAVEPLGAARVALVCEHVPGPTLAEVRAARPPLQDGEVVTVAVPVAQALGALHADGLAHGAVGADRVVVGPGGVPVLVDLRGALRGVGTPTGDLHRLVAGLLGVMASLDAHLAAGLEGSLRLRDALEGLLRAPVGPDDVVDAVFAVCPPEPLLVPDAGELAGAQVALAHGRVRAPREEPAPVPARRERRAARGRRRWPVVLAVAALGAVAVGAGLRTLAPDAPRVAAAVPSAEGSALPTPDDRTLLARRDDPVAAAGALTRLRAAALAGSDATALAALEVEGSPAAAADATLVEALAGARSEGLRVDVLEARSVGGTADGAPLVEVTSTTGAHVRVAPDGARTEIAAADPRTVVLELQWVDGAWRVRDVREPGAAPP